MTRTLTSPRLAAASSRPAQLREGARPAGRSVHPWAWWVWALTCAATVSLTRNPLMIALVVFAVVLVVLQRRSSAPWARSVRAYFILAGVVIGVRMLFQVLVGGLREGTVLFSLPEVGLPDWAAGIRLGGPVTVEGLVFTLYDAGRLAAMLVCIGAANALANPKRALRSVPAAFHQVSTAIVIALSVAPQLVESAQRIRRARRLRGRTAKGIAGALSLIVPVLEDAVERSMSLAAGMESRGYGRTRDDRAVGTGTSVLLAGAMLALLLGTYALLGVPDAVLPGAALLTAGAGAAVVGLRLSGRRLSVSRYRPDPWGGPEFGTCGSGLLALGLTIWLAASDPAVMNPGVNPLVWPELHPVIVLVAALVLAPGFVTPTPGTES